MKRGAWWPRRRRSRSRSQARGQRADYVREGIVRQPGDAVVVGPARIHPVTRAVGACYASRCTPAITLVIPDREDRATGADRKVGLPLRLGWVGVAVQLEWGTESHPAIGRADVEHVSRVAVAGVARGINVVNDTVVGGRLARALVSPVIGSGLQYMAGEVAATATARAAEGGAGVGVGPGVTAVGGPEDEVVAGVRPPPPSFIPAMYTSPVTRSPVIWTLRMKGLPLVICRSLVQVRPSSVEKRTKRAPPPRRRGKSFQETYIRP